MRTTTGVPAATHTAVLSMRKAHQPRPLSSVAQVAARYRGRVCTRLASHDPSMSSLVERRLRALDLLPPELDGGTLLGVSPRQLTDWFWVAYADAYDWVVEPNVLAMATYGVGELMTTKPYVAGSAYIAKMSDYCGDCAFHPKKTCPITRLYWDFLARNAERLDGNMRIAMPLRSLKSARKSSGRPTPRSARGSARSSRRGGS